MHISRNLRTVWLQPPTWEIESRMHISESLHTSSLHTSPLHTSIIHTSHIHTSSIHTSCLHISSFHTSLFTTRLFTGTSPRAWRARRAHPLGRRVRRRRRRIEFGNGLSHIDKPSAPEAQEDGSWDLALNAPRARAVPIILVHQAPGHPWPLAMYSELMLITCSY